MMSRQLIFVFSPPVDSVILVVLTVIILTETTEDSDSERDRGNGDIDTICAATIDSPQASDIVENRYDDEVLAFRENGCGCKLIYDGVPCCDKFSVDELDAAHLNFADLEKDELDLVLLAHIQQQRASGKKNEAGSRASVKYYFCGKQVCQKTFLFIHNCGIKRFKNLVKHFDKNGFVTRRHGNKSRTPAHASTPADEQRVVSFITNYADTNGLPLPGRLPKQKDYKVMMLPSSDTKTSVWRLYRDSCVNTNVRPLCLSTFKQLWLKYVPFICVMKIASDLCYICQKNNNLIMKSNNLSEVEKSSRLQKQEQHLASAQECRQYYQDQCWESAMFWNELSPQQKMSSSTVLPGSIEGSTHISFDYAQQLFVPHSPQQVGPIYFKTPRIVQVFGVCCEAKPEQMTYLIDESQYTGKGANTTISLVHHYIENHSIRSKNIHMHCDNCVGQNKNNFFIFYILYRTMVGLNDEIEMSFMLVGHTRFGPDWFFGIGKMKYRRSYVSSLRQLGNVLESSTKKQHIKVQYMNDLDSGDLLAPTYDWKSFFGMMKPIPQLTTYQHFRVHKDYPGVVFVREFPNSGEIAIKVLRDESFQFPEPAPIPNLILPKGLSVERQWYLYQQIRQHCDEDCADVSCPKPSAPKPKGLSKLASGGATVE